MQELTEVTEAMPMMAQHTMVVVTDLDIFRLDEQQRTALMALLADFPSTARWCWYTLCCPISGTAR